MQNIEIQVSDFIIFIISWSVILFGIALAAILFFKQSGRKLSNRILSVLLLIAALFLVSKLVVLVGLAKQFWTLYVLPLDFTLSIPPLIYFYCKFKLHPESHFHKKDLPHFIIPSIQAIIYLIIGCSSLTFKTKIWENGFLNHLYFTEDLLLPTSILFYSYACFRLLYVQDMEWSMPLKQWLFHLLRVLVTILTLHVFFMLFVYYRPTDSPILYYFHYLLLLSFLLFISLKAWDQYFPERIYRVSTLYIAPKTTAATKLDHQWFQVQTQRLFEKEQIFLNPDLNLALLCKAYGISKRNLSEYTQSTLGKNINELINHYRIQYVVKCLDEGQHHQYNILSISYSAGFASKSTFYRVFKKMMQCSPSEYIEQLGRESS